MNVLLGGKRLKERRENLCLTQPQLAERAEVPQKTISRLERGEIIDPGIGLLLQVARALSVTLQDLQQWYEI